MSAARERWAALLDDANVETLRNADSVEARVARARLAGYREGLDAAEAEAARLRAQVEDLQATLVELAPLRALASSETQADTSDQGGAP